MKTKRWLACMLSAAMVISMAACSSGGGESTESQNTSTVSAGSAVEGEDGPFAPYAETVTMDFGVDMDVNSGEATKLAEAGEPYDDNRWIQLFKEKLNVQTNYELVATGEQYNQQIKLLMSSNELPDYFKINDWSDFQQMADAGLLTDMTDIYEQYASPLLKSIMETEGEQVYLPVTYNGRMYGLPRTMPSTNGYNHLWIRQDWLDNLGLERPKTMEDVLEIARPLRKRIRTETARATRWACGSTRPI
ncbi:extracellular solute-binding protein [Hominenteromicrobium sp.]|uniref:extracellular solute-binding protein n=1 Tax=Hominenteromicrobium sp. TaxID=3073581 RepID=UPI0039944E49